MNRVRRAGALVCGAVLMVLWPIVCQGAAASLEGIAGQYLSQGRYLEALSFYRDLAMNAGTGGVPPSVCRAMADLYFHYLGDAAGALPLYRTVLTATPTDAQAPDLYLQLARAAFSAGHRDAAAGYYRTIPSRFPGCPEAGTAAAEQQVLAAGGSLPRDVAIVPGREVPERVRVLLHCGSTPVQCTAAGGLVVQTPGKTLSGHQRLTLQARDGLVDIGGIGRLTGPVRIVPATDGDLHLDGAGYRGFFDVQAGGGELRVVNHVDLEDYLRGVLPREMSPSWPEAALQAQAVAARTYALYHMIKRATESWDVYSTTSSQVYGGRDVEHPAVDRAVAGTHGSILTWQAGVALTLYHANSGGRTAGCDAVWGASVPCLVSVPDASSCGLPGFAWEATVKQQDILDRLAAYGFALPQIDAIEVRSRGDSGRISWLALTAPGRTIQLSGNSFRLMVGPGVVKSTSFQVQQRGDLFVFTGNGYGHGVGMSQWGARAMARRGSSSEEILRCYYPGTTMVSVRGTHAAP